MPHGNPRFKHKSILLPAIEGAAMRENRGQARIKNCKLVLAARCFALAGALCFLVLTARAQEEQEQQGVNQGNYNIKQSIEFGGRLVDVNGDGQSYNTFVNLQQGPRLLGFTVEMRSLNHTGEFSIDCISSILDTAATRTTFQGSASARTSGTTSTLYSAKTRIFGIIRFRRILRILRRHSQMRLLVFHRSFPLPHI